jgi:EpsI family protein
MIQKYGRFLVAASLLMLTALFLHGRSHTEIIPQSKPLSQFPMAINGWNAKELEITDDERSVLGTGDFMARRYWNTAASHVIPVDLFIAYFPSQRAGQTMHSPKNCMPGGGWLPSESRYDLLEAPGRGALTVNRYVLGKGGARMLVFYWYQAHSRAVANEYKARLYMVADAARMNRTDGALIRINTVVMPDENLRDAETRLRTFAAQMIPQLDEFIPR